MDEKRQGMEDPGVKTGSVDDGTYGLPPVLTVVEAARFLRLNVKTVYDAIAAHEMPGRKIRGRTLILRDAMLEWMRFPERVLPSRKKRFSRWQ